MEGMDKNTLCLSEYLRDLGESLMRCTKPIPAKRERTDLSIWREILDLYNSSLIFCETKECSRLSSDFVTVQKRYKSFTAKISAKNYVLFWGSLNLLT
jgi:hypothetical protein